MTHQKSMLAGAALALSLLAISTPAAAIATLTMSSAGQALIGMHNGRAAVVYCNPSTGGRAFYYLNQTWKPTLGGGGLLEHWLIRGSNGNDVISVVGVTASTACGDSVSPMVFNDFGIYLDGRGGSDDIFGGSTPRFQDSVRGGSGSDLLIPPVGGTADGEGGSDYLYGWGGWSGTENLYGGREDSGADDLCEWSNGALIWQMDGGPGLDAHCGWGVDRHINLEYNDCGICF